MQLKEGFHYDTLGTSEIRLVEFLPANSSTPNLRLKCFESAQAPPYLALSYVQGDPSETVSISIDSWRFEITPNLSDALNHIHEVSDTFKECLNRDSLFLWVDALCINMKDDEEKSAQVLRMSRIYSQAFTVLAWLGTPEQLQPDGDYFGLKLLVNQLEASMPFQDFQPPKWEPNVIVGKRALDDVASAVTHAYRTILDHRWFHRTWTVQEYALSQRTPYAMLGRAMFSLYSLFMTAAQFMRLDREIADDPEKIGPYTRSVGVSVLQAFGLEATFMQAHLHLADFADKSVPNQLLWLLHHLSDKSTSIRQDHIYGILGMIDCTKLPDELRPDYRKSYHQVCQEYTRFLIESLGDLRILSLRKGMDLDGAPSWVPDMRDIGNVKREPALSHHGVFVDDGMSLVLDGVKLERIVTTFFADSCLNGEVPKIERSNEQLALVGMHMTEFYEKIVCPAADILEESPSNVWKDWFSGFLAHDCGYPREYGERYDSPEDFVWTCKRLGKQGVEVDIFLILNRFLDRQFALLEDGEIAYCVQRRRVRKPGKCRAFALKGSTCRSILCQVSRGRYQYLGTLGSGPTLDQDFFSEHKTEKVTLV